MSPSSLRALVAVVVLPIQVLLGQTPRLVLDVRPGPSSSMNYGEGAPSWRAGEVFLVLDDTVHGRELWRTDGTAAGTRLVIDLTPGPIGSLIRNLQVQHDGLWFVLPTPTGEELWRTDGTAAGTARKFDARRLGAATIEPPSLWFADGSYLVSIDDVLWRTDGTVAGSRSLGAPAGAIYDAGGGRFWAHDDLNQKLWTSDGTAAGTVIVMTAVMQVQAAPGGLFVSRRSNVGETTVSILGATTVRQVTFPETVRPVLVGDVVIAFGQQTLWRGDFRAGAARLGRFIGFGNAPGGGIVAVRRDGRAILFTADDGAHGVEAWWSDATPAGTRMIADLTPGAASTTFGNVAFAVQDRVVFWADTAGLGSEPWSTDGTPAETVLLGDLEPGSGSSTPDPYFGAIGTASQRREIGLIDTPSLGNEPWITDGSPAGTRLLADLAPGPASSIPRFAHRAWHAGPSLVFAADDGTHGVEPHAIDLDGVAARLYGGCSAQTRYRVGDPVLGGNWELHAAGVTTFGIALISLETTTPFDFGGRCLVQIDLATSNPLATIVPDGVGEWTAAVALPSTPALRGVRLVTQAAYVGSALPLGVEVGDAWSVTLGR